MARGNLNEPGLLKEIVDLINAEGPEYAYHPREITDRLLAAGHWKGKSAETPLRTVTSYFSDNPQIFNVMPEHEYRLIEAYHKTQGPKKLE